MRFLKSNVVFKILNSYLIDSPQPSNISYFWNFGSLLGICLIVQILTGIFLAMHYIPHIDLAFSSVEHIMRDVNMGWAIRYTHANVASFFFIFVYAHIARGIFYSSYTTPRVLTWSIGVVILVVMMATAFLGYVLPMGQMSYWGATVITNLLSAIPIFGQDLVQLIWGGFSVSNATLNRFFSLHYLLPFILAALVIVHLLALHNNGSNNPIGFSGNGDRYAMQPFFTFKDLVTIFVFFVILSIMVCFYPNLLGHSDNYIPANPMQTPISIVPEWYLLPYYAILRSIPNKLLGVIAMFGSLLILLLLPLNDLSRNRGNQFKPFMKIAFFSLSIIFAILMWLGSQHPTSPFAEIGFFFTILYFGWFGILMPIFSLLENTLSDIGILKNTKKISDFIPFIENNKKYINYSKSSYYIEKSKDVSNKFFTFENIFRIFLHVLVVFTIRLILIKFVLPNIDIEDYKYLIKSINFFNEYYYIFATFTYGISNLFKSNVIHCASDTEDDGFTTDTSYDTVVTVGSTEPGYWTQMFRDSIFNYEELLFSKEYNRNYRGQFYRWDNRQPIEQNFEYQDLLERQERWYWENPTIIIRYHMIADNATHLSIGLKNDSITLNSAKNSKPELAAIIAERAVAKLANIILRYQTRFGR